MRRFGYARDPLCWVACGFYAANRWGLPNVLKNAFLRHHFNDLLFVPAALPLLLWVQRRLGLRTADRFPDWREVVLHWLVWSLAAEVVGPRLFPRATGDVWDVVAYAVGAAVAAAIWHLAGRAKTPAPGELTTA